MGAGGDCSPSGHRRFTDADERSVFAAAAAAARVLTGVVRAAGGEVPPGAARLVDAVGPAPATTSVDSDRTWLRALAELGSAR